MSTKEIYLLGEKNADGVDTLEMQTPDWRRHSREGGERCRPQRPPAVTCQQVTTVQAGSWEPLLKKSTQQLVFQSRGQQESNYHRSNSSSATCGHQDSLIQTTLNKTIF